MVIYMNTGLFCKHPLRFQNRENEVVFTIRMKTVTLKRVKRIMNEFFGVFTITGAQKRLNGLQSFGKLLLCLEQVVFLLSY